MATAPPLPPPLPLALALPLLLAVVVVVIIIVVVSPNPSRQVPPPPIPDRTGVVRTRGRNGREVISRGGEEGGSGDKEDKSVATRERMVRMTGLLFNYSSNLLSLLS